MVRNAGQLVAPPPEPPGPPGPLVEQLRTAVAVAVGLWPLTGVVLLMIGMLWLAGISGSP